MKVICRERCSGKTAELVKHSAKSGAPIVCVEPEYVVGLATQMGLEIPTPLTIAQFKRGEYEHVLLDDADWALRTLLGCEVDMIALTES